MLIIGTCIVWNRTKNDSMESMTWISWRWSFFMTRKDVITMISKLAGMVDGEMFVLILIALIVIAYFIYKEWPEFQKRVSKSSMKEKEDEITGNGIAKELGTIKVSIDELRDSLDEVKERQSRDYKRLNSLETENDRQQRSLTDSLKERKLLMKGIMACLDGLEQQGCNHTVPSTKMEIHTYLNEAAHADDS